MNISKVSFSANPQNTKTKTATKTGAKIGAAAGFGGYIAGAAIKEGGIKNLFTTLVIPHPEIPDQLVRAKIKNFKGIAKKTGVVGAVALGAAAIVAAGGAIIGKVVDVVKNKKNLQENEANKSMMA